MATAYESRNTAVPGCQIRYLVGGDGPPVVFVHGGGGPHWSRFHDLLATRARIYAIDLPGYGESTISALLTSIYDVADTIASVIMAEQLDRPGLIGESIGGHASAWTAIRHPDLLGRLVLESPGGLWIRGTPSRADMTPEQLRAALFAHRERLPEGYGHPERQPRGFMPQILPTTGWDADLRARLPEIHIPTLIVRGDLDGTQIPESTRIFRELIPHSWRICIDDAAHVPHLDQPELAAALMGGFLVSSIGDQADG